MGEAKSFPQSHHFAWLDAHPDRTFEWLKERMADGFHVHHIDGNHSNNAPLNLLLIDGVDHMRLHGMKIRDGISSWRKRRAKVLIYDAPIEMAAAVLDEGAIAALLSRIHSA